MTARTYYFNQTIKIKEREWGVREDSRGLHIQAKRADEGMGDVLSFPWA